MLLTDKSDDIAEDPIGINLKKIGDLIHAAPSWHPRLFFTMAMYAYDCDVTIQYYPNPNLNHRKGTKNRIKTLTLL